MTTASGELCVTGHCYCGGIKFEVRIPSGAAPIFTAYCHCDSCRRAHSAPLYQVACVDEACFRITDGAEHLQEFQKPSAEIVRAFCGRCGSRVLNRFPGWTPQGRTPLAFFPNLLDEEIIQDLPAPLVPTRHNDPEACVLDAAMLKQVLDR